MKPLSFTLITLVILGCNNDLRKPDTLESGYEANQALCIEKIFNRDSALGDIRNQASENISLSEAIANYTKELDALDYSNCPGEFVSAFREHIAAWNEVIRVTDNHASLRGEMHDLFGKLEKSQDSTEFKGLLKRVWDTWQAVEESVR